MLPGQAIGAAQRGSGARGWSPGHRHCWLCRETPGNEAAAKAVEARVPMMIIQIGENEMERDPGGVAALTPNPLVPRRLVVKKGRGETGMEKELRV